MSSLENSESCHSMDDQTALTILDRLANADPDYNELAEILRDLTLPPVSVNQQAKICKEALHIIKDLSPERETIIEKFAQRKGGQKFFEPAGAIWIASIVILMRSHIKYHKKADGTWEFKIEHKPADNKIITEFLKKIGSFLPK